MRQSNRYANRLRNLVAFIRENLSDLAIAEAEYDRALEHIDNPCARKLVAHIKSNIAELVVVQSPGGRHPKVVIDFWALKPTQSDPQARLRLAATQLQR